MYRLQFKEFLPREISRIQLLINCVIILWMNWNIYLWPSILQGKDWIQERLFQPDWKITWLNQRWLIFKCRIALKNSTQFHRCVIVSKFLQFEWKLFVKAVYRLHLIVSLMPWTWSTNQIFITWQFRLDIKKQHRSRKHWRGLTPLLVVSPNHPISHLDQKRTHYISIVILYY